MAVAATKSNVPAQPAAAAAPAPVAAPPTGVRAQKLREAQVRKIAPGRMKPFGHYSEPQQVVIPADWDMEDVLNPECWAFIAPNMQANTQASVMSDRLGTLIEVRTEDHAFFAQLYVNGLKRNNQGQANAMVVTCIGPCWDAETDKCYPVDVRTGRRWTGRTYDIAWNATKRGFDVVRKANGEVVADGAQFQTREAALAWIAATK